MTDPAVPASPCRLVHFPLTDDGSPPPPVCTRRQGRTGGSLSPAGLMPLIASIAANGLLHPPLTEAFPAPDGGFTYQLVAGERRLRAMLWGSAHLPGNPHFAALPVLARTGPLTATERRSWQLAENLNREDLQPGELAAQLVLCRGAVLEDRLAAAGHLTAGGGDDTDPLARYRELAAGAARVGVAEPSWKEVITAAGAAVSPRRARALVAAFTALPRDLSEDMDRHKVTLAARLTVAEIAGPAEAAREIWAAVSRRGQPRLLGAAALARAVDPSLDPAAAADRALAAAEAAASARAARRTARPAGQMIDPAMVEHLASGLRNLAGLLRAGGYVDGYGAGSLRLMALEVAGLLGDQADPQAREAG